MDGWRKDCVDFLETCQVVAGCHLLLHVVIYYSRDSWSVEVHTAVDCRSGRLRNSLIKASGGRDL